MRKEMQVYVYKGENRDDHYLFLDRKVADSQVPESLLTMLGELSLIVEFDLTTERKLPQADAEQVRSDILQNGFYLQMPKKDMRAEEDRVFS